MTKSSVSSSHRAVTADKRISRLRVIAATILSMAVVVGLIVTLVWVHPWSASASGVEHVGTRFTISEDEAGLYVDICKTEGCSSEDGIVSSEAETGSPASSDSGAAASPSGSSSAASGTSTFTAQDVRNRIRNDKALLLIAKDEGYGDAVTYEAFVKAMRSTNTEKSTQAKAGETVYGVTSYTPIEFHSRLITQASEYLEQKLSAKQGDVLYVSDSEARSYFNRYRNEWRSPATYTVLHVTVPVPSENDGDAVAQLNSVLDSIAVDVRDREGDTADVSDRIQHALPDAVLSDMTLDASAASSPQMQQLIVSFDGMTVGDHTSPVTGNDAISCYLVTGITQSDDDKDWAVYESRIKAQIANRKLDTLIRNKAKTIDVVLDDDTLAAVMKGR